MSRPVRGLWLLLKSVSGVKGLVRSSGPSWLSVAIETWRRPGRDLLEMGLKDEGAVRPSQGRVRITLDRLNS